MEWSLTGIPLPIVLRPPSPLTDNELIVFSRKNKPFRIERNAKGKIEIMTPLGGWGKRGATRLDGRSLLRHDHDLSSWH